MGHCLNPTCTAPTEAFAKWAGHVRCWGLLLGPPAGGCCGGLLLGPAAGGCSWDLLLGAAAGACCWSIL
eukprot:9448729-Alexandrium_andersonii.AAC.1